MKNVKKVVREVLKEYLDKDYMKPLYDYINDKIENPDEHWFADDFNYASSSNAYTKDKNPSVYAFTKPEIIHGKWLIHIGNNMVYYQGFNRAFPKEQMKYLYMTSNFNFPKSNEGYSFAFDTDDKYLDNKISKLCHGNVTEDAIMFIANGIKVQNTVYNDYGREVIFFNKSAHDFVRILNNYDYDTEDFPHKWNVMSNDPNKRWKPLYSSNSIEKVIKWVKENYAQYRKELSNRKEYTFNKS